MRPYIKSFVKFKPQIGTEGCQIIGLPGSGKSNFGNHLFLKCLTLTKDCGLLRGDRFAEWRHFLNYSQIKKLTLYHPEDAEFAKIRIPKSISDKFIPFDPENPEEFKVLNWLKPQEIVVIYDACFDLASRAWFWVKIFEQILNRHGGLVDTPVTFLDHEAGVLWPELALADISDKKSIAKNHWRAVNKMCELFVDFRKALIRPILISQLEAEIKWQIRLKCAWQIYRKGRASDIAPTPLKKTTPMQTIEEFCVLLGGGLYSRQNKAPKFTETKSVWKMIPLNKLTYGQPDEEHNGKQQTLEEKDKQDAKRMRKDEVSIGTIAKWLDRSKSTIWKWTN